MRARLAPDPRRRTIDVLRVALGSGLRPATVVDVGAAYGRWSLECQEVFPGVRYVLIEPLAEYSYQPQSVRSSLRGTIEIEAAATREPGMIQINVHEDLVGSSLKREQEGPAVDGVPREVRAATLDDLCAEHSATGPYILKVDVQGAELDVLGGAERMLRTAELVFLEVSFFRFYHNGPLFHEVVAHMSCLGFVPYDFVDHLYRPLDGALAQLDVVFVRSDGPLRALHLYATPAQRADIAERFKLDRRAGFSSGPRGATRPQPSLRGSGATGLDGGDSPN